MDAFVLVRPGLRRRDRDLQGPRPRTSTPLGRLPWRTTPVPHRGHRMGRRRVAATRPVYAASLHLRTGEHAPLTEQLPARDRVHLRWRAGPAELAAGRLRDREGSGVACFRTSGSRCARRVRPTSRRTPRSACRGSLDTEARRVPATRAVRGTRRHWSGISCGPGGAISAGSGSLPGGITRQQPRRRERLLVSRPRVVRRVALSQAKVRGQWIPRDRTGRSHGSLCPSRTTPSRCRSAHRSAG